MLYEVITRIVFNSSSPACSTVVGTVLMPQCVLPVASQTSLPTICGSRAPSVVPRIAAVLAINPSGRELSITTTVITSYSIHYTKLYDVERLIQKTAKRKPDVILLPELWNTGFAPGKIDPALADDDGARTKAFCAGLAKQFGINLVAGSVLTRKSGMLYNTAYVRNNFV